MAMITPPIAVIGARIIMLSAIMTTCWTCWTSLVLRVISDGVPNRLTSVCAKLVTRRKMAPRTSRPNAIDVRAPRYTDATDTAARPSVTKSITAPTTTM